MGVFVRPEAESKSYRDIEDFYVFRCIAAGLAVVVALVFVIGGFVALASLHQEKINDSQLGAYYTDGAIEGQRFDHVMKPGSKAWVINDHVYKLPARQITWITGPGKETDADTLTFQAKGGEVMQLSLSTRVFLNDDDKTFGSFFTSICQKFECWKGSTGGHTRDNTGWNRMLRETIGNPEEAVARDVGLRYDADKLRYDANVRAEFARDFAEGFAKAQTQQFGGDQFFCGRIPQGDGCSDVTVRVTNIQYGNEDLEHVREQRELAVQQEKLAVQQEAAAKAQQRVNAAKATPEYERLTRAQAMLKCAEKPDCTLIFSNGGDTPVAVPAR